MTGADARIVQLLKEARAKLEAERKRRTEPIAIVGIGCRFPGGAASSAQFWELLTNGVDATREVPQDRWDAPAVFDPNPSKAGKAYTKRGAFLEQITDFDPEFFGISPREALGMDPQQRLLLEVAWEALEDAGIPAESLRGSATGVWIGLSLDDYARRAVPTGELERIDPYNTLGNARSVAAGRIAYVLGLQGPVLQLDTACSSSLVAVHLACESLRAGESDLGLVGAANLMSSPEASVALSKLMALSPDGRCKTFDATADGYGRGEGVGIVVLKRLSDAQAASDRVYAVIRGSAVNHDGRSNGLTAPNGLAQEALIRRALANAEIEARTVAYVEAHGTGTLLGDPIEVMALSRVYGVERDPGSPLRVGSVKTNLGHLEAAAGIAALIKVALSVSNAYLVPSLHFRDPNPKIPWASLRIEVSTEKAPWPAEFSRRLAGVSSFGISGTNAHVLVEQAPDGEVSRAEGTRSAELVVFSARSEAGLSAVSARLLAHLQAHPELTLSQLAHSLAMSRSLLEQRVALAVTTREQLCHALERIERADFSGAKAFRGRASEAQANGKTAFVFTGQGAQVLGMGQALSAEWPVFRAAIAQVFEQTDRYLDRPLREVMWAAPNSAAAALLSQTAYTQPALFAFEWALACLWRSWGVEPDFVIGHSVGELTAACVAGLFSVEDATWLVCERGRLMQALAPGGAMLAVAAPEQTVREALVGYGSLGISAVNSPVSVVISGDEASLSLVNEHFRARGIASQRLDVSHAFHSRLVEPMLAEFVAAAERVSFAALRVPLISNLSGQFAGQEIQTAEYWARHAREAVRFADGVRALSSAGARTFLELGPRATLLPMIAKSLSEPASALLASGRTGVPETEALLGALAAWVSRAGHVNWSAVFPGRAQRSSLPLYPFQRQRYWLEASRNGERAGRATHHPLLGRRLPAAGVDATYEVVLSAASPAWLTGHRIGGRVVMPGAGLLELVRAAGEHHHGHASGAISHLLLQQPLLVAERAPLRVQVILSEGGTQARVYSQALEAGENEWTLNASARVSATPERSPSRRDVAEVLRRCSEVVDPAQLYTAFWQLGLEYGAPFKGLKRVTRGATDVLADLELEPNLETTGYAFHPALLDAALQAVAALNRSAEPALLLPFEFGRCVSHRTVGSTAHVHVRLLEAATPSGMRVALEVFNDEGDVLFEIEDLYLRRAPLALLTSKARQDLPPKAPRSSTESSVEWRAEVTRLPAAERMSAVTHVVRAEVARVLSLANADAIPLDQPLNELGLDSIMAVELRDGLATRTSAALPATLVLEQPTAGAIASYLFASSLFESAEPPSRAASASQLAAPAEAQPAFIADAVLDSEVRATGSSSPAAEPRSVLLSGATGFLGAFLLSEILNQTQATVSCVVRAADSNAAMARVVGNLQRYGLWNDAYAARLRALAGDLALPNLGLSEGELEQLAEQTDAIYNNGAQLSFAAAYRDLKASHVNGTRAMLRLASRGRAKVIHHVSSTVVYDSSAYRGRRVSESTRPTETEHLYLGYSQCKWVTENLIWEAAARGLPVTVHRPAFIGGSSESGAWNTADFVCRLLKSIVESGYMPGDLDLELNLSPVDYVARSIVELTRRESARGRAFHLHHRRSLRFEALGELLRGLGYSVTAIPYWDWIERLNAQAQGPLYALVPILSLRWPPTHRTYFELSQRAFQPRLECIETERDLAEAGITCPPIDGTLLDRYLRYLIGIGYITKRRE